MTAETVLAIIGLSLGTGSFIGWNAALRWQRRNPTRQEQLARKVYRHLDEIIGATKYENQLRADKRFAMLHPRLHVRRPWKNWWLFVPRKSREWMTDWLWPIPRIGAGVNPLPSDHRIAKYVQASPDLRVWTIWYTSEAPANHAPFIEWLTKGRPVQGGGLAQALGREWTPNLFEVERNWAEGLVRLTLNGTPTAVPTGVPFAEVTDE